MEKSRGVGTIIHKRKLDVGRLGQLELQKIICSLKNDAAAGSDGICVRNLKTVYRELDKALTVPINKCLKDGEFPSTFKHDRIQSVKDTRKAPVHENL